MKMNSDAYEITLYSPLNNHILMPHFLMIIKGKFEPGKKHSDNSPR